MTTFGDVTGTYNTIVGGGALDIETKGKTKKVQFKITGIGIDDGDPALVFVLGIFTDKNPGGKKNGNGKHEGHQCYTSPCLHYLNSGATLKFTDPVTDFQLSAHTCPIPVYVTDAMLELDNKDPTWERILGDGISGELYYSTEGDVFCYEFRGFVLEDIEYSLIYYADFLDRMNVWGGNNPGALIGTGTASGGTLTMSGSVELNMGTCLIQTMPIPPTTTTARIAVYQFTPETTMLMLMVPRFGWFHPTATMLVLRR